MVSATLDSAELLNAVTRVVDERPEAQHSAEDVAAAVAADLEAVQAALLVLAASGRVEVEAHGGRMVVVAVAPPVQGDEVAPTAIRAVARVAAVMSRLERFGASMRRVMWFAPFVGLAAGGALAWAVSVHDRPLTSLCGAVFGGIVGYLLRDSFGPRTWWDWLR